MKFSWLPVVLRNEILSLRSLFWILIGGFLYLCLSLVLLNIRLLLAIFPAPFTFFAKLHIFFALFLGLWTSLSRLDFILLIINALLVGLTILLLGKIIYRMGHTGKVKFSVGGATIISLLSTGCTSCGLSVLSFLGLSASLSFLPFYSIWLHIVATIILLFSVIFMLWQLYNVAYCKL